MAAMIVTFVLVSVALTLVPGPDMMFIIRSGLQGRRPAIAALLTWLRRPAVNRWLERITGACMVGLGVRTALERA